jgi:protein-disulfide isomerase
MASRKEQKEQLKAERVAREADEQAKERRRRMVQYGSGAAFLAICAVAVLIIISQSGGGSAGSGTQDADLVTKQLQGVPQHGTVLGNPKAKVTLVEYGDLQCPVCEQFSTQVTPDLITNVVRKGTASYEFRQFTIIGPDSATAAKAALAAAEQNRYFNFIELFYRNQGVENSGYVTDAFLENVAKGAGVPDLAKWNKDRNSSKVSAELKKVQQDAQALGLSATPSFVVDGPRGQRPVGSGVLSVTQLESAIKSAQ